MAEQKKAKKNSMAVALKESPAAIKAGSVRDLSPEDNAVYVAHAAEALRYDSVDLYDTDAVWKRLKLYINSCRATGMRPTPPGLANWLGVTSEELRDWMIDPGDPDHRRLATRLYEFLRASWADYALSGKTPASIAVFVAKNWFAMSDANKIAEAPQVKSQLDLEKLAAEAAALPDSDVIDA